MVYLNIDPEFGYVVIVAASIAFECFVIGAIFPGRARSKYFTKKFLEEHFGLEHK